MPYYLSFNSWKTKRVLELWYWLVFDFLFLRIVTLWVPQTGKKPCANKIVPDQTAPRGAVWSGTFWLLSSVSRIDSSRSLTAWKIPDNRTTALRVEPFNWLLLTLCMLGNFSCFCCRLLTFFKNFFQEHYQECWTVCIKIQSVLMGLNCLQRLTGSADGKRRALRLE